MGADAVSIGTAAMIALGCNKPVYEEDYRAIGTEPGYCHHCHTGRCPGRHHDPGPGAGGTPAARSGARGCSRTT